MSFHRLYLTVIVLLACGAQAVQGEVSQQDIERAIGRIKSLLYEKQDSLTGGWEFRSLSGGIQRDIVQVGGETALVTLSLLISGESAQDPKLIPALRYLRKTELAGTYAVSMRAHVWSRLPAEYMPWLEMDASWLLDAATRDANNLFGYQAARKSSFIDNSVVQYGILGLWEASKRGLKTPRRYWERWAEYFLRTQRPDGSWSASDNTDKGVGGAGSGNIFDAQGIGTMTTAGLTTLLVAQQELFRNRKSPEPKITAAIQKAMDWLDRHFDIESGDSGYNHYYLYGIEQVALASGVRYLNGLDWYRTGADQIIHDTRLLKGIQEYDPLKLGFAMMFLSRGRFPVWINKLRIPGKTWNNHPNDLHFLNLYLSDQREDELNWQTVGIDEVDPVEWIHSPVTYLASDEAIEFTRRQRNHIKRYLDMGGLLVTSSDNNSSAFSGSIRLLAAQLYPEYEMKPMKDDHLLFHAWHHLSTGDDLPVSSLSNGARELIIMGDFDWGYALQSEKVSGKDRFRKFAANLFAYATDRGVLNNRLEAPFEKRGDRPLARTVAIGRARYDGNWLPEPEAWQIQSNFTFNRTGLLVKPTPARGAAVLDLNKIGRSDLKLIHLTGTDPVHLTQVQLKQIDKYIKRGGTLLVETVGGKGRFSEYVLDQLTIFFDRPAVPLNGTDAIISSKGLTGGFDCRRALYRRYSVVSMGVDPKPRLIAFLDDDNRPAVIISHEDLSLGMLGSRHWGIHGYHPETARKMMTNIVLWAEAQHR